MTTDRINIGVLSSIETSMRTLFFVRLAFNPHNIIVFTNFRQLEAIHSSC